MFALILPRLLLDATLDLIYFPLWWYSRGAGHAASYCFGLLKSANAVLAPGLWLKNIFVPMFGQYDWQGRIISFFMRLAQIIGRAIALFVATIFCVLLFLLWPIAPVVVVYGLWSGIK